MILKGWFLRCSLFTIVSSVMEVGDQNVTKALVRCSRREVVHNLTFLNRKFVGLSLDDFFRDFLGFRGCHNLSHRERYNGKCPNGLF